MAVSPAFQPKYKADSFVLSYEILSFYQKKLSSTFSLLKYRYEIMEKEKITHPVVNMFKVNMGLKEGEKILVLTDVPTPDEWIEESGVKICEFIKRSMLAKTVYEIAEEKSPNNDVEFCAYPSVGKPGTNPGKKVEEKMVSADVVIAITTYSLSHTEAREAATHAGARIASMPNFHAEMFYPKGPMAADYSEITKETSKLIKLLEKSSDAMIRSKAGTDLSFSIKGMDTFADTGILKEKGAFGNLPAGEAATIPVVGTANGKMVVEKGWFADLEENMNLLFEDGMVTCINGGGAVGEKFRRLLDFSRDEEPYLSRRNCAELGIGTNPNAKRPDISIEAEKIRGTVHVAIGDNRFAGGYVRSDLHQDFVIPKADLVLDGKIIMKDGKLLV